MNSRNTINSLKSYRLLNIHLRRTGFYTFLTKSFIKLVAVIGLLVAALLFIQQHFGDIEMLITQGLTGASPVAVIAVFFASESLLGLIPPDLFILWGQTLANPKLMVLLLAVISYIGGIASYFIGKYIASHGKMKKILAERYPNFQKRITQWGGLLILVAALFPIPYSAACMVTGAAKFSFKAFLFWGLARIPRFFLYLSVINFVL
ncbi:MAG: VTT domain-containing protein [Bacteroidales bacterium]|nr:VTT domain-containing protein [Bacteroidales bacterium]MBN2748180.1 VTT domain-containing protein [Bacteroidales bacterium]